MWVELPIWTIVEEVLLYRSNVRVPVLQQITCSVCFSLPKYLIEVSKRMYLSLRNVATFKVKSRENFRLKNKWNIYNLCTYICVQINIMFPVTHYTLPVTLGSASGILFMNSMTLSIILKVQGFSHFLGISDHKVKTGKWFQPCWYVHFLNMKSHVSVLWEALRPGSSRLSHSSNLLCCN